MKNLKSIGLNVLGVVLGSIGGTLIYFFAEWLLFDLIPCIPFIPKLISWPVDYEWYALTGVLCADIGVGIGICSYFCNLVKTRINYGVVALAIINALRYLNGFIAHIMNNGFTFSLLFVYGIAFICILVASISLIENEA